MLEHPQQDHMPGGWPGSPPHPPSEGDPHEHRADPYSYQDNQQQRPDEPPMQKTYIMYDQQGTHQPPLQGYDQAQVPPVDPAYWDAQAQDMDPGFVSPPPAGAYRNQGQDAEGSRGHLDQPYTPYDPSQPGIPGSQYDDQSRPATPPRDNYQRNDLVNPRQYAESYTHQRPPYDQAHARYDPHPPPPPLAKHPGPQKPRRPKSSKREKPDHQQIQIVMPDKKDSTDSMKSITDQMQMMMMNQMMNQQMTAQQLQMAQMNAMVQKQYTVGSGESGGKKKKRPSVNVKTKQKQRPMKRKVQMPVLAIPPQPVQQVSSIESAAMENWQEATIILCIAIVGVMYLVVSRTNKAEEKEASLAAKHLVPK